MLSQFLFIAYWLLLIPLFVYCGKCILEKGDWRTQVSAALVLIPVMIRLLLLK